MEGIYTFAIEFLIFVQAFFCISQASHTDTQFLCVEMYALPTSMEVKYPQKTSLFKFRFLECTHEYPWGK